MTALSYLCAVIALLLLPLSLAAFASLNSGVPQIFWVLEVFEQAVSARVGLDAFGAFTRGLGYGMLAVVLMTLAAWIKPRW